MRTVTRLATGEEFSIDDVRIRSDHSSWFPAEVSGAHRLVLVRSGLFQLRVCDWEIMAHPVVAYVARPGDEQRIAHRIGALDTCTSVTIAGPLFQEIAGDGSAALTRPMFTTGRVDLLHRVMVARARARAEEFELLERITRLADELLTPLVTPRLRDQARSRTPARRLADAACELVAGDPVSLGLTELARRVGVSPHYLSRVFHQETGMPLTRFRNQIRVRRVLDRIEAGDEGLAGIAADLGFADHAHMTRMVRDAVGEPPASVRRLFASATASAGPTGSVPQIVAAPA